MKAPVVSQALLLTAPGMGALATVRLVGPGAPALVRERFDRPTPVGRCVHGRWHEADGEVLDDPLVVFDGKGYDVNLHGGRRIVARLLQQAADAGFEVLAGEPALDAAAVDDVERWLPHAATEAGVRMLLSQPAAWAALESEAIDPHNLLADLTLRRLLVPATVALVGAANVGKSTLANRLFGQERSIVADVPGTTRDWVGHLADLAGLPVMLVDTPGRRASDDAIEQAAIGLSDTPLRRADLVVLIVDATRPDDVPPGFESALHVANKCDLAPPPQGCLPISAETEVALPQLIMEIHNRLSVDLADVSRPNLWTAQQVEAVRSRGLAGIREVRRSLSDAPLLR